MNNDKINILCQYLDDNVAQRYPISNSELAGSTDYIKNGYLKMLAVVMQQANITNAQLIMFGRIVAGANVDKVPTDYLRMALDIEIKDYINFTNECKDSILRFRWVLDALIISCVKERSDKQVRLIAQFTESYKITKEELKYISTMAKAILTMDVAKYVSAYEIKVESVPDIIFSDYMYLISKKCICANENLTILQATYNEKISIQMFDEINEKVTPCVKIVGIKIDMANCKITFTHRNKVIFEDCTFIGGEKSTILFEFCNEVEIWNCTFENFEDRTLVFESVNIISIDSCEFNNCKYKYRDNDYNEWKKIGCVIYSGNPASVKKLKLTNTTFYECGGINESNYCYGSEFISNIKCSVNDCKFEKCWHGHEGHDWIFDDEEFEIDPENKNRTMFTSDSLATNCQFIDSAKFN